MLSNKTLWWTLLIGWIIGSAYWHVCKIKQLCDLPLLPTESADSAYTAVPAPSKSFLKKSSLKISDGTGLNLVSSGNFLFAKSDDKVIYSVVKPQLDSLSKYLLSNPSKRLTITGIYSSDEKNTSVFPDLGIARAKAVKNILVTSGVADTILSLKSELDNGLVFENDSLSGGISFLFGELVFLTESDLAKAQKYESIFKPMDLYFPKASASYIKTEQNQKFLIEAKKYLLANQDKKLILTGHTDDEDSAEWNLILSKKRALSVKRQFSFAGIDPNRIVTIGKGETRPKLPNDTAQGKKANRRVTIVVQ
jgi:OmpA-OmpF porin, OOP family